MTTQLNPKVAARAASKGQLLLIADERPLSPMGLKHAIEDYGKKWLWAQAYTSDNYVTWTTLCNQLKAGETVTIYELTFTPNPPDFTTFTVAPATFDQSLP